MYTSNLSRGFWLFGKLGNVETAELQISQDTETLAGSLAFLNPTPGMNEVSVALDSTTPRQKPSNRVLCVLLEKLPASHGYLFNPPQQDVPSAATPPQIIIQQVAAPAAEPQQQPPPPPLQQPAVTQPKQQRQPVQPPTRSPSKQKEEVHSEEESGESDDGHGQQDKSHLKSANYFLF